MKIIAMEVGVIGTNCYLVINEEKRTGVVIDPGGDADHILEKIRQKEIAGAQSKRHRTASTWRDRLGECVWWGRYRPRVTDADSAKRDRPGKEEAGFCL